VSSPSTTPVQPGAPDSGPPEGPPDGPPDGPPEKERNSTRTLIEWVAVIGGALIVALIIKTFLIQAFYIPSGSMEPTLDIGDRVLVNKLSYRVHDVHRGDLVVFERPEGEGGDIRDLIKRVIGLGGETIEGRDGHIVIDGRVLSEPYLPEGVTTGDFEPVEIPEDQVWVMGDNRGDSRDSRSFGPIAEEDIVGRAFIRVWPVGDIGFL
jgi:signal peptidase I